MKFRNLTRKSMVLLVAATIIAGCGGAEQRKAKYLEKGKAYIEQKNFDKAKIELKNVLQIDPKHAEAYFLLGQIEEQNQDWERAYGGYSKAYELNPDYQEARVKLAQLYLLSGNTDEATEMVGAILAKEPGSIVGKTISVAIIAKKGDIKKAIQEARALYAAYPKSTDTIDLMASLYLADNRMDLAAEVLEKGVAVNPANMQFRANLIKIYIGRKQLDKAEQMLQEMIRVEPEKLQHRAFLASLYAQINQADKAEKILREAIAADSRDVGRYLLLAEFLATRKGVPEAEKELLANIKDVPEKNPLRLALAYLYERTKAYDKAEGIYREIIKESGTERDGLAAMDKLAGLLATKGQYDQAEQLISDVLKENPQDSGALILKGRLALATGNPDEAIASFRTVLKDQPNSVDLYTYLADANMMSNAPELAKENLMKALELNPQSVKAHLAVAQYYAKTGDYDTALQKADLALKVSPNNFDVMQFKVEIYGVTENVTGLRSVLLAMKETHPDNPIGYYQLGQFYLAQKKYDAAIREFESGFEKFPDVLEPLSGIASAYLAQNKADKAISRLSGIIKEEPDHPFAHELLAEVYISTKKYDEATKELNLAIKANPKWNVPYRNLANSYLVRGDFKSAEAAYQQGLQALPDDPNLLIHLAESYERTQDYAKAISTYERILRENPTIDVAANNLASLLTDRKGDSKSLKQAIALTARFKSSPQPAFRDTLAWAYYKSGEMDTALALLKDIVKQAPAEPVFRYHLGMVYYKQGNMPEAKIHLAKALEGKRDFSGKDEARAALQKIP